MTFISYAQNLEDVILWRALSDIEKGFYIDVGANDPQVDSVTIAFYKNGWRGINIEPMQHYHARLCAERPEDINLEIAVGETAGILPFYEVPESGLSTLDREIAAGHQAAGWTVIEHRIPVVTLTDVCRDCATGDIHFLKIDVEGAEHRVLAGMDFRQYRPWIVVVEATLPNSQQESYTEWEPLLLEHGYRFVYFDGLNRFYLAEERAMLSPRFNAPPNWFDHYVRYSEASLHERYQAAERELAEKTQLAEQTLSEKQAIEQRFAEREQHYDRSQHDWQLLEEQLAEQKQLAVQLQSEKQAIEQRFTEREQQYARSQHDQQALEEQLAEQKQLAVQLQSEKQVIEQQFAELKQENDRSQHDRQALEEQLAERKQLAVQLQSEKQVIEQQFAELKQENDRSQHDRQALEEQLAEQKQQVVQLQSEKEVIEQRLQLVWAATSWRITAPLRAVKVGFRRLKKRTARRRRASLMLMQRGFLWTARRLLRLMKKSSRMRRLAMRISQRYPKFWKRIRYRSRPTAAPLPPQAPAWVMALDQLHSQSSPSTASDTPAEEFISALKAEISRQRERLG
jgi:FkbM family methyltransferase